jgi:hypothetical protein
MTHKTCGPDCALELAQRERISKQRKESREKREKLKTRSEHLREAQSVFNAYIRERDSDLPCISCGRYHDGQYHAGHYRSVGAAPHLRFSEINVHKQCSACNNHKSGNVLEYRIGLIARIGQERVAEIESDNTIRKWTIADAKSIKAEYREKLKGLKNANAS